ncbi:MAG TPA: MetQ/NlpA family ABC transporter substrate-binding protein [Negativicutes bacterium]|nr:MetQ/NlpA family ABC transporter substrate-binding protein [Negativicutes bacterium]
MKKIIALILTVVALTVLLAGCGDKKPAAAPATPAPKKIVLKVGATPVPHAEILKIVQPILAKDGIDLQIVEFTDYVRPNVALAEKELDANFFQHIPYLQQFAADRKLELTHTVAVHIEPMGVYSKKIKNLNELPNGAQVAIPNDPTNGGRALLILAQAGVIKLKDGVGIKATVKDVTDNPKKIVIKELEAPLLPRALDDVSIAVINANYALEAKLVPTKDALFLEKKESPYANILTVRKGDENRPEIVKLSQALTSPDVKKFIEEKYKGAVVPAF